jgi:ribonuclease/clavin/mitogillin
MLIPVTDRIKMVKASSEPGLLVANSLLVEDEQTLLIDAGFGPGNVDTLRDIPVDYLVNSHFHEDHVMFNWLFSQAQLFVPLEDAEGISSRQTYIDWYGFQILDGQTVQDWIFKNFDWREYHTDNLYSEGHKWELGSITVQALHTPGHTKGHYAFWLEKERILFAADVALTPTGPWYGNITSDVDDFIASIKRLKALKPQVVVSAHRNLIEKNIDQQFDRYLIVDSLHKLAQLPVDMLFCSLLGPVPNGQEALLTKLDFMQRLRDQVLDLHHQGLSPTEIRIKVLGEEEVMTQMTDGHYSKQNTVDSILGILKQ